MTQRETARSVRTACRVAGGAGNRAPDRPIRGSGVGSEERRRAGNGEAEPHDRARTGARHAGDHGSHRAHGLSCHRDHPALTLGL